MKKVKVVKNNDLLYEFIQSATKVSLIVPDSSYSYYLEQVHKIDTYIFMYRRQQLQTNGVFSFVHSNNKYIITVSDYNEL